MDVKTKRSKGLRRRFKRSKNDERKRQAAQRNTLQPVTNMQLQPFSFDMVQAISLTRTMPEWTTTIKQDTTIQFCIMGDNPPAVIRCVEICFDLSWQAYIFGQQLSKTNTIIKELPSTIFSESCLNKVLSSIMKANLCPGSPEDHFVQLLEHCTGGKRYNRSGEMIAYIQNRQGYLKTVRTANCEMICHQKSQRCPCCSKYRANLFVERSRHNKVSVEATSHDSHVNYCFLTMEQKDERLRSLENAKRLERQRNVRLHQLIFSEINNNGVSLHPHDSEDIASLTTDISDHITKSFPVDSIQRIFWEQQMKYNAVNKKQMRWHPYMIRFALNLKYASTAAYRAVQQSGVISLPSERTLRDYTHWLSIKDGPQSEALQHVQECMNLTSDSEDYFALSMDEMKIRSGLFFRKHTGELVGFANLGEANENLELLIETHDSTTSKRLAEEVLVFMLRHISKPSMSFPVAMYPSASVSGEKLYPVVFEVVEALELHGLSVVSITSDGNSPNHKFYRMCGLDSSSPTYKTPNPYALSKNRDIYFFCDPPHLLKTTRNNFANSYYHTKTRRLWVSC